MVYFREKYNFPRFQEGVQLFPGGGRGKSPIAIELVIFQEGDPASLSM